MTSNFNSLDKWRSYFRTANCDIFVIIEHAIIVAAADCPYDFRIKRDRIAELLFSCKATKCLGCDRIELALPNTDCLTTSKDKCKSVVEAGGSKDTKESKVNSCSRDDNEDAEALTMKVNQISNFSYGDPEALTDEIDEEYQFHGEVLRIKEILDNNQEESDLLLFESLRSLRLMTFNVETLKATEIGKSVNGLRKHRLKEIRSLARALVEDWKVMVDSWVNTTASIAAAEVATESVKTSTVNDEEGLPSPPMDEGAFFATPTSMELSRFFDGMDDDGNPQPNCHFDITRGSTTKPQKGPVNSNSHVSPKAEQKRNVEATMKKQPGWLNESAPDRLKHSFKPKLNNAQNVKKDLGNEMIQKPMPRLEKPARCDEGSVGMKLEAAKRKLHERYQEAENAKKQRTIQVVELHDLPKQNLVQRNQHNKPGMQRKQWSNTRR